MRSLGGRGLQLRDPCRHSQYHQPDEHDARVKQKARLANVSCDLRGEGKQRGHAEHGERVAAQAAAVSHDRPDVAGEYRKQRIERNCDGDHVDDADGREKLLIEKKEKARAGNGHRIRPIVHPHDAGTECDDDHRGRP